jgi:hypothetical protein
MRHVLFGITILVAAIGCDDDDDDDQPSVDGAPDGGDGDAAPGDGDAAPGNSDAAPGDTDAAPGDTDAAPALDAAAGDADGVLYPLQIIRRACSPTGAPAVHIELGAPGDLAFCEIDRGEPHAILELWLPAEEIEAPANYSYSARGAIGGRGTLCPGDLAPCRLFVEGDFLFDLYEVDVTAGGTWRVVGDGEEESGPFAATWCSLPPAPCD